MRLLLLLLLLSSAALAACSSSSSAPTESGPCAQRVGRFRFVYTETSGTCGAIADSTQTSTVQPTAPPAGCKGTLSPSPDNCTVSIDTTCPATGSDVLAQSGTYTWSHDAGSGHATMQITLTSPTGTVKCQSSYEVSATRL